MSPQSRGAAEPFQPQSYSVPTDRPEPRRRRRHIYRLYPRARFVIPLLFSENNEAREEVGKYTRAERGKIGLMVGCGAPRPPNGIIRGDYFSTRIVICAAREGYFAPMQRMHESRLCMFTRPFSSYFCTLSAGFGFLFHWSIGNETEPISPSNVWNTGYGAS